MCIALAFHAFICKGCQCLRILFYIRSYFDVCPSFGTFSTIYMPAVYNYAKLEGNPPLRFVMKMASVTGMHAIDGI